MSGYTKIPNELFDRMADLSPAEFKLAMALHRLTTGFHRKGTRASVKRLAEMTGLSMQGVHNAAAGIAHLFETQKDGGVTIWVAAEYAHDSLSTELTNGSTPYQLSVQDISTELTPPYQLSVYPSTKETVKETVKESEDDVIPLLELVEYFTELTGIKSPDGDLGKHADTWLHPIVDIYKASNDDFAETRRRMAAGVQRMREIEYTIATPKSIRNVSISADVYKQALGVSDV